MDEFRSARMAMVDSQLRASGVMDRGILSAMADVPRELFVAEHRRAVAYVDDIQPLPQRRFLLSPSQFGRIAQLGKIGPDDHVLDVGVATGYSTVILARQARKVIATEHAEDLASLADENLRRMGVGNAELVKADNFAAVQTGAFDVIIFEGALESEPEDYIALLSPGGRLVAPVIKNGVAVVGTFTRTDRGVMFASAFDANIPLLRSDVLNDEFRF